MDQRQHDDAEQTVALAFKDFRTFLKSSSADFSRDGIFVETEEPAPPGATVALELSLSDGHPLIRGRGAVAWSRVDGAEGERPGMGVRFLDLDSESERLVGRIVEERVKAGLAVFDLTRAPSATPETPPLEVEATEHPEPIIPVRMTPEPATDDRQDEIDDLEREHEEEQRRWQAEREELGREHEEDRSRWQAELEGLGREHEEERSRWQAELDAAREEAADLSSRLRDSLSRMMVTVDARDALAEELRSVQGTSKQDRQRIEKLDAERSQLQHQLEVQGDEVSRWTEEAVAATTEREALEEKLAAAHDKVEELASEIGELRRSSAEEIADAKAELATATSAKDEIEARLQENEAAIEELEKEAAEAENSLSQRLDEARSEMEEEQRKNEALADEAKTLEEEIDRVRAELAEAWGRAEKLEQETGQIREAMAELQTRHDEMEAEAATERKAAARAEKLVERVRAEHASLQNDLAEAEAVLEEIKDSDKQPETEPAENRKDVPETIVADERSGVVEPVPKLTVKARLADLAARMRGGQEAETYSDLMALDDRIEPAEEPLEAPEPEPDEDE